MTLAGYESTPKHHLFSSGSHTNRSSWMQLSLCELKELVALSVPSKQTAVIQFPGRSLCAGNAPGTHPGPCPPDPKACQNTGNEAGTVGSGVEKHASSATSMRSAPLGGGGSGWAGQGWPTAAPTRALFRGGRRGRGIEGRHEAPHRKQRPREDGRHSSANSLCLSPWGAGRLG